MKIFVTGHKGYIGVYLVELLREAGHYVIGCDIGLFDGCEWEEYVKPDAELAKDLRIVTTEDLAGVDCVMHLGALSNDPMGDINPDLNASIEPMIFQEQNLLGSVSTGVSLKIRFK